MVALPNRPDLSDRPDQPDEAAPVLPRVQAALEGVRAQIEALWAALAEACPPAAAYELRLVPRLLTIGTLTLHEDRSLHSPDPAMAPVALTALEYRILEVLLRHQGQVVTFTRLVELVWDWPSAVAYGSDAEPLKTHVCRLRHKLGHLDPDAPALLRTRYGLGYWVVP